MVSPNRNKRGFIVFVNVCRWLLALVLMLSGFLKAVDPVGGMYKLQEYASAFSLNDIPDGWLLAFAVVQAAAEFLVGLYLLMGVYRGFVSFIALFAMLLFTPFSLYLWTSGVVSDCGCFGEAVVMSNAMTFFKNVLLLVLAIVAFGGRRAFARCLSSNTRWMLVLFSLVYIFAMQSVALHHLPLLDSGSYAVGSNLRSKVGNAPANDIIEGVWVADDYAELSSETSAIEPEISNFSILDWDYDIELSDMLLADTGYVFIVPIESVEAAMATHVDKINDLYDYCLANGMAFCAVSSSGEDALSQWTKHTGAEYPVYWADANMLRSMLHANPGLLLLKDGMVVGKWAAADIPDVQVDEEASVLFAAERGVLYADYRNWPFWVIVLAVVVLVLSLIDVFCVQIIRRERDGGSVMETAETINDDTIK